MRIISGKYKGRVFDPPSGFPTRPTTDRAREGLFNILVHRFDIAGADVLDLFAGAGGVSFEFLSRGANHVVSVDRFPGCVKFIRETCAKLKAENGTAVQEDVMRYLRNTPETFDIIFADPPYEMPGQREMIGIIMERKLLNPDGLLILEHNAAIPFDDMEGWQETREYGKGAFSFFSPPESE